MLMFRTSAFHRSIKKYLFLEIQIMIETTVIFLDAGDAGLPKFAASVYVHIF